MHLHGTDVLGPTERTNANQISVLEMHKQGTHHERDKGAGPPLQFPFTNMVRNMCVTYIHLGS